MKRVKIGKSQTTVRWLSNNQSFAWSEDGADWLCKEAGLTQGNSRFLKVEDPQGKVHERLYRTDTVVWIY